MSRVKIYHREALIIPDGDKYPRKEYSVFQNDAVATSLSSYVIREKKDTVDIAKSILLDKASFKICTHEAMANAESITEGELKNTKNGLVLEFNEICPGCEAEVGFRFAFGTKGVVTLQRRGIEDLIIVLEENVLHKALFESFGQVIEMEFRATRLTNEVTKKGGHFFCEYETYAMGDLVEKQIVSLDITVAKNEKDI